MTDNGSVSRPIKAAGILSSMDVWWVGGYSGDGGQAFHLKADSGSVDGFMRSCVLLDVKSGTLGGRLAHALALEC